MFSISKPGGPTCNTYATVSFAVFFSFWWPEGAVSQMWKSCWGRRGWGLEQLLSIAMMKHDDFFLNRSCFSMILGVVLNVKISTGIPTMIHELSRCLQRCRVFLRQAARLQTSALEAATTQSRFRGKTCDRIIGDDCQQYSQGYFPNFSHVSNLMDLWSFRKSPRGTVTTVYTEGWKFLLRNDAKNPGNTLRISRPTSVRGWVLRDLKGSRIVETFWSLGWGVDWSNFLPVFHGQAVAT